MEIGVSFARSYFEIFSKYPIGIFSKIELIMHEYNIIEFFDNIEYIADLIMFSLQKSDLHSPSYVDIELFFSEISFWNSIYIYEHQCCDLIFG